MSAMEQRQAGMTASGVRITPFGAEENPDLLETLPETGVVRIDTLTCLEQLWGANILMSRQHLYELVSGDVTDEEFRLLISSYYKRFAAFANYVDEKYLFEDESVPLLIRIIKPVREMIDAYSESLIARSKQWGGKYLGKHCDYLYFLFTHRYELPFQGVTYL